MIDDIVAYASSKRKETGIYRSIGLSKTRITKIYIVRIFIFLAMTVPLGVIGGIFIGKGVMTYVYQTMGIFTKGQYDTLLVYGIGPLILILLQLIGLVIYGILISRNSIAKDLRNEASGIL